MNYFLGKEYEMVSFLSKKLKRSLHYYVNKSSIKKL